MSGQIQLPYEKPLPLMVIVEIAKWNYDAVKGH